MNHAKNRSRARLGGLLALALGVAALLAIPVVSAARSGGNDDGPNHEANHEQGHHHRHHGHHRSLTVGTISSFDAGSGILTIDLRRGDEVSGLVDSGTRIKCEGADDNGVHRQRHGGDDRARRSGEAEPGDDHGRGANCTTAALVVGAVVQEADLEVEHGVRHFDEVELAH